MKIRKVALVAGSNCTPEHVARKLRISMVRERWRSRGGKAGNLKGSCAEQQSTPCIELHQHLASLWPWTPSALRTKSLVMCMLNFVFDGARWAPRGFVCGSELWVSTEVIPTPPPRRLSSRSQTSKTPPASFSTVTSWVVSSQSPPRPLDADLHAMDTKRFPAASFLSARIPAHRA